MKKLLFTALLGLSIAASAFVTDKNTTAGYAALNNFEGSFKKASDVSWTVNKDYSKATFVLDNVRMEALYNVNGELIGTTKAINMEELPVRAKRSFAKRFEGYTVTESVRFESNEENAYYISANNEKETVIVKIDDSSLMSTIKSIKK